MDDAERVGAGEGVTGAPVALGTRGLLARTTAGAGTGDTSPLAEQPRIPTDKTAKRTARALVPTLEAYPRRPRER